MYSPQCNTMSAYARPFLVLNIGSEMIFVIAHRLEAQKIPQERATLGTSPHTFIKQITQLPNALVIVTNTQCTFSLFQIISLDNNVRLLCFVYRYVVNKYISMIKKIQIQSTFHIFPTLLIVSPPFSSSEAVDKFFFNEYMQVRKY